MSSQRRQPTKRRREAPGVPRDLWGEPVPLPDVEPIESPPDVTALIRSLGDPPLRDGVTAGHYLALVIHRSAAMASALALSIELESDTIEDRSTET